MKNKLIASAIACAIALAGCPSKPKPDPTPAVDASAPVAVATEPTGNAVHGKELALSYQCNRCHDGTGHPAPVEGKDCVHCHDNIMHDNFKAPPATLARWKPRVKEYADAPSLEAMNKRMSRQWFQAYLLQPTDLRPNLHQYMPRLAISVEDARDISAYYVPDAEPANAASPVAGADLGKGRQVLETKGCGTCHVFSGVAAVPASSPPAMDPRAFESAHRLAPDLRFTRDRMSAVKMIAWLTDPESGEERLGDAEDRPHARRDQERRRLHPRRGVTAQPKTPKFERLPVLTRKVVFKEVDEKVFHRSCWHCHSEPDYAIGDGGPGNSGGFGFKPRGLNLSDYNGIAAGFLDDKGERQSVFAKDTARRPAHRRCARRAPRRRRAEHRDR